MTQMNHECSTELLRLVESQNPTKCLVLSHVALDLLKNAGAKCQLDTLPSQLFSATDYSNEQVAEALASKQPDLVIMGDALDELSTNAATEAVAAVRNRLNAKIILLRNKQCPLGFNDLLGLGFKREFAAKERDDDIYACDIYGYDIASYNKKRDWNNSRFWANPQNFEKFRW